MSRRHHFAQNLRKIHPRIKKLRRLISSPTLRQVSTQRTEPMTCDTESFNQALFEKVLNGELFKTYQQAFRTATGLPLQLMAAESGVTALCQGDENGSAFCKKLSLCKTACQACILVNQRLNQEAKINGPTTCHCFSGMSATAVPLLCNGEVIGLLRTGQIFHKTPSPATFAKVSKTLSRQGLSDKDVESLKNAYLQTQVVNPERYQSMVTLLSTFASQLGKHAEKLALISEHSEPEAVARARKFIDQTLADPLPLSLVAKQAGLSESHFCRVFKDATGLTLTDYVNRRRIEWAKKELLKPEARVSEIAFHIGYQSLSQFNRSFARFTGNSPTNFRREELARVGTL